jgi:hypothetical protein
MMKKVMAFMLCCALALPATQAQLLQKLKNKAQKALDPSKKEEQKTSGDENAGGNDNNGAVTPKQKSKKDWIDTTACHVVFTLDGASGEKLLYDETSVFAKDNKLSYAFVTSNKNYEYYMIEDGNRTGPFKYDKIPLPSMNKDEDEEERNNSDDNISLGNDKKDPVTLQYSKTIGGKLHIVFNGKNYGPYDHVAKMIVSPDKKKFFALVTIGGASPMTAKMGMGNSFLVNEGTLKQKLSGPNSMPMRMLLSSGFKQALAIVMESESQKVITVSSTGKKTESGMEQMYSGGGGLLKVSDAGDIISVPAQSPTQVLVNGDEAAAFKVPITNSNRLFLLPDISKSVYYEKGKLYRGDGSVEDVSYITFPKVVTLGKETALYYYKMRKNDSGDTEVFLCKKGL